MAHKVLDDRSQSRREARIYTDVVDGDIHPADEIGAWKGTLYSLHYFTSSTSNRLRVVDIDSRFAAWQVLGSSTTKIQYDLAT